MTDSARQKWIKTICNEKGPGRYLFSRQDSAFVDCPDIDADVVKQYLDKIQKAEQALTASLFYMSQSSVVQFHKETLPQLHRNLNRSTVSKETVSPSIRGRIIWGKTKRLQLYKPNIYASRKSTLNHDIPENQLLKFYINDVKRVADELIKVIGTGHITKQILEVKHIAASYLKERSIRNITLRDKPTSLMRKTALRNKQKGYSELAVLSHKLTKSLRQKEIETIIDLISRGWFEPIRDDDLFEIYVLVNVIQQLTTKFGEPTTINGISALTRSEVAVFVTSDLKISVFFDQSPETITKSQYYYTKIANQYNGIYIRPRRPDITIKVTSQDWERILLIEAKFTESKDYVNDSIYKALGYLRDFEVLWDKMKEQKPKVVLVFPEGDISPSSISGRPLEELEILSAEDTSRLDTLVTSITSRQSNET